MWPIDASDCSHDADKYVTLHGLACVACLTPADFARYPKWQKQLETRARRAELARRNFNHETEARPSTPDRPAQFQGELSNARVDL